VGRTATNTHDFASGLTVAGDDPVNESDPSGDSLCWPPWQCLNSPAPAPSEYQPYHSLEYGYCQTDCGTLGQEEWVLTSVVNLWTDLSGAPKLQASEAAFDEMLDIVVGNYQANPTTQWHSECGTFQDCVSFLATNDGSGPGGSDFQDTHDNSINWWSLQLSSSPYWGFVTYADWFDKAELLPEPTSVIPVVDITSCSPGTSSGLTLA
jgi:hypothetical protein